MDQIKVGHLSFDYPLIMNAAGMCKTFEVNPIVEISRPFDAVVIGSITPLQRSGNTGTCEELENSLYGLNSWGMPNGGVESAQYIDGLHGPLVDLTTPIIVSVAGFSSEDYHYLIRKLACWGSGIEINLGCPNVRDDGSQHKIASFDPEYMAEIFEEIRQLNNIGQLTTIGVKLSPYSDPGLLKEIAAVIIESGLVHYVATCNTFPNGIGFDNWGRSRIQTDQAGWFGGISGRALNPISLSNAYQFRQLLPESIAVIRVGGISTARDVWESYQIGCVGVQIGTAYAQKGPRLINTIREDLASLQEELA